MGEIERYQAPATDSWVAVVEPVGDLATKIAQTDFVPRDFKGKPAHVAAAILFGREVGLPPMTALRNTHVINGRPDLSAEAQRALVLAAGHQIEFVESTATRVKMRGCRRGSESWLEVQYTLDEAKSSGDFSKNPNYKSRPQEMLVARCTTRLAGMLFPDVVGGFTATFDLDDEQPDIPAPATVSVAQKLARKAPARRKPKAAPTPPPQPETVQDGPPLPGEDGYDQLAPEPGVDTETGEIVDAEIIDEPAAEPERAGPKISPAQMKKLHATLRDLDVADREHGLSMISDICAQPIESTKDLTREQASMVIDTLSQMAANEVPS